MKKKNIISCIILICLLILIVVLYNYVEYKNNQKMKEQQLNQNNIRYAEIKKDVNKEMQRYHYVIWPTCDAEKTANQKISDGELINNGGMDKKMFLDVDGISYCDTITYATCTETNKWEFKTYIRCKDYIDDKFVDWD